ncbi:hypothetical protein NOJ05_04550 [Neorhizobium galegae]|uniref:hypothetical protein n=1 Tax=Neorhizobium galegae TaxID=399 RepID=UPI0006224C8F|nr:hypothetical protein [Neorhizobium galegae]CDZ26997.1 Hypothetical protein NGAL_HAMBI490_18370 [Neorhizobium galegae bv. officinalis]MCQ1767962.1 hypothetical protein [Neorhizobium galegae]MCQ1776458.1 hypothetical protein [Neorhizobium galegae]MCQ1798691.1 hypothetical protein [Neorhizobium galegae]MCQ1848301.1 hypothetical protein [Neorhizobium galegae]
MALVVVAMLVSTAAEGHLGFKLPLAAGTAVTIEEVAELGAYIALLATQFHLATLLGRRDTIDDNAP